MAHQGEPRLFSLRPNGEKIVDGNCFKPGFALWTQQHAMLCAIYRLVTIWAPREAASGCVLGGGEADPPNSAVKIGLAASPKMASLPVSPPTAVSSFDVPSLTCRARYKVASKSTEL